MDHDRFSRFRSQAGAGLNASLNNPYIAYDGEGNPKAYNPSTQDDKAGGTRDLFDHKRVYGGTCLASSKASSVYQANDKGTRIIRSAVETVGNFYRFGWLEPDFFEGGDFGTLKELLKDGALSEFETRPDKVAIQKDVVDDIGGSNPERANVLNAILYVDKGGRPEYVMVDAATTFTLTSKSSGKSYRFTHNSQFQVDPADGKIQSIYFQWDKSDA